MLNKKINIFFILFLNRPFLVADSLPVDDDTTLVEIPLCSAEMTVAECSKGKFDPEMLPPSYWLMIVMNRILWGETDITVINTSRVQTVITIEYQHMAQKVETIFTPLSPIKYNGSPSMNFDIAGALFTLGLSILILDS